MIEFILNHAKLKFMKNGDFGGVELCDTYVDFLSSFIFNLGP